MRAERDAIEDLLFADVAADTVRVELNGLAVVLIVDRVVLELDLERPQAHNIANGD